MPSLEEGRYGHFTFIFTFSSTSFANSQSYIGKIKFDKLHSRFIKAEKNHLKQHKHLFGNSQAIESNNLRPAVSKKIIGFVGIHFSEPLFPFFFFFSAPLHRTPFDLSITQTFFSPSLNTIRKFFTDLIRLTTKWFILLPNLYTFSLYL